MDIPDLPHHCDYRFTDTNGTHVNLNSLVFENCTHIFNNCTYNNTTDKPIETPNTGANFDLSEVFKMLFVVICLIIILRNICAIIYLVIVNHGMYKSGCKNLLFIIIMGTSFTCYYIYTNQGKISDLFDLFIVLFLLTYTEQKNKQ